MGKRTKLERTTTSKWSFFLFWTILFGLFGWFTPVLTLWVEKHLFDFVNGWLEWVLTSENTWMLWIRPTVGVLIGGLISRHNFSQQVKMELTDDQVKIEYNEQKAELKRQDIAAVWLELRDYREIVFLDADGVELYREYLPNVPLSVIRGAFIRHHYPWKDQDPYAGEYVLWTEDDPAIGELENISLSAREKALKEGEYWRANQTKRQLGRMGILIYDKGKKQHIRVARKKQE